MPRLSAILVVRNEADQLADCLTRLRGLADEIIVVDDESTDGTPEVARRFTDRIFVRKLDRFGAQKQFALDQATGDWVLALDADEQVTPALHAEISRVISDPDSRDGREIRHDGYEIRRDVYFLGRRLRYGGLGRDRVLRLFRRGSGRFSDDAVHERLQLEGRIGRLQGTLAHQTHRSLRRYVEKINLYSDLAARSRFESGRRFAWWMHLRPGWEFFSRFFLRGGFLDGHPGLLYAGLSAYASWLRALKLWELGRKEPPTHGSN